MLWTLNVIPLPTTNLQVLHQCSICMTNFQHPVAQFAPAHPHSAKGQCPPILLRILFQFLAVSSPGHPVAESSSFNALDEWVSCAFVLLWWTMPLFAISSRAGLGLLSTLVLPKFLHSWRASHPVLLFRALVISAFVSALNALASLVVPPHLGHHCKVGAGSSVK